MNRRLRLRWMDDPGIGVRVAWLKPGCYLCKREDAERVSDPGIEESESRSWLVLFLEYGKAQPVKRVGYIPHGKYVSVKYLKRSSA